MIYYKFKSAKDTSQILFDGPSISVFDLKREIILRNKLGNGSEFDLAIYSEQSVEEGESVEYRNDDEMIRRATSIIAVRRPPYKPGKGTAVKYVADLNIAKRARRLEFPTKNEVTAKKLCLPTSPPKTPVDADADDITKIMAEQSADWNSTQERMSHATPAYNRRHKPVSVPEKPLPSGYVCHRCGIPGHWIQACPSLNDPTFQDKRNLKAPTGIPKSFLKKTDKRSSDDESNSVMVNANGEYVVVQPDNKSWETYQAKQIAGPSGSGYKKEWECEICGRWAKRATRTPCCKKLYCFRCIEHALVISDFMCPGCEEKEVLLDALVPDEEVRSQITERWESRNGNSVSPKSTEMKNVSVLGKRKSPEIEERNPSPKRSRSNTPTDQSPRTLTNDFSTTVNTVPPFMPTMPFFPYSDPFMMAAMGLMPSMPPMPPMPPAMAPTAPRSFNQGYNPTGNRKNNGFTRRHPAPRVQSRPCERKW
jgi:protein MPE1